MAYDPEEYDREILAAREIGTGARLSMTAPNGYTPEELLTPCGTVAAWWRHTRRGEPIDNACRIEYNKWHTSLRRNKGRECSNCRRPITNENESGCCTRCAPKAHKRKVAPCGTVRAYRRHMREGEEVDVLCRLGKVRYDKEWREQKRRKVLPD